MIKELCEGYVWVEVVDIERLDIFEVVQQSVLTEMSETESEEIIPLTCELNILVR